MVASDLEQASSHLDELVNCETFYWEKDRDHKMGSIRNKIIAILDNAQQMPPAKRAKASYIRGRALGYFPETMKEAQESLQKAVKLDPELSDGWVALGEVLSNSTQNNQARSCLEQAAELCGPTPWLLRTLSIVLRRINDNDARAANVTLAVEKAKEATAIDINDAESWLTLGNSYTAEYFTSMKVDALSKSLKAFDRAEMLYSKQNLSNGDLHMNKATVLRFLEEYSKAIDGLFKAHQANPTIGADAIMKEIIDYAKKVQYLIEAQGRLKPKVISQMTSGIKTGGSDVAIGGLQPGVNKDLRLVCKFVTMIEKTTAVPCTLLCVDADGHFFVVSIYSCDESQLQTTLKEQKGDIIIPNAFLRDVTVTLDGQNFTYRSVRVAHPEEILYNGSSLKQFAAEPSWTSTVAF